MGDDRYEAGENSAHADILAFLDELGIPVDRGYSKPLRKLKDDHDRLHEFVVDLAEGWVGDVQARAQRVLGR